MSLSCGTTVFSGLVAVRSQTLGLRITQAPGSSTAFSDSMRRIGWPSGAKIRKVTSCSSDPLALDRAARTTVWSSAEPCRSHSPLSDTDSTLPWPSVKRSRASA